MATFVFLTCILVCLLKSNAQKHVPESQINHEMSLQLVSNSSDMVNTSMLYGTSKLQEGIFSTRNRRGKYLTHYLSLMLIVLSYDVELNPGPNTHVGTVTRKLHGMMKESAVTLVTYGSM